METNGFLLPIIVMSFTDKEMKHVYFEHETHLLLLKHAGLIQLAKETHKRNIINVHGQESRLLQVFKYELQPTYSE